MDENTTEMITPQVPLEEQSVPVEETAPEILAPEAVQAPLCQPEEAPAAPKAKKKLNKKLLIACIAVVLVAALAVGLLSLLGGGTKNTGVFIMDEQLYLYVQGKKEPIELTDRLWKNADNNSDFASMGSIFTAYTTVRGDLVFYPDKYSGSLTLYLYNISKPKEDPEKIDSGITFYYVTEDGKQMLYIKDNDLYLYDVKHMEETRVAKDILQTVSYSDDGKQIFYIKDKDLYLVDVKHMEETRVAEDILQTVSYSEDLSKLCYLSDGDAYLWTAKTEDVKIAKDIVTFSYFPENDLFVGLTTDGEVMMKTADMEEAEEIADKVTALKAVRASGEIYYTRSSTVERTLLDYLDDDMLADDAAITKPQKPNYPTAPQRVYSWNYATTEAYQAAKEQYDLDYAAYLEKYNAMKEAYNNALELYYLKSDRDSIRESLRERTIERMEYALYCYVDGEEILLSDSLVSGNLNATSTEKAVLVYNAYVPTELVKPKMSEITDMWEAPYLVQQAINDALYSDNEYYLAIGSQTSVIEQTAASQFILTADGSALYFLDAPFVAYSNKSGSYADAPAAEAPAMEAPAATEAARGDEKEPEETLIPENQREYASLYCVSIADGQAGEPSLVDSDISIRFAPRVGTDPSTLIYAKAVDAEDSTGEFYVGGQLLSDEATLYRYTWLEDYMLFFTDWDAEDKCGTLCMMKLGDDQAEVIEIADDVYQLSITENNDVLYLQDYSLKRHEGTLFLYDVSKGKSTEIADDVIYLG